MSAQPSILALHGFFGSGPDWTDVLEFAGFPFVFHSTPDLPGHGKLAGLSPGHRLYRLNSLLHWLRSRLAVLPGPPRVLIGYSLGGRMALHLAHRYPDGMDRLVLIGSHFGISDPDERIRRRKLDAERATRLREIGSAAFHREWMQLPLFATRGRGPEDLLARLNFRRTRAIAGGLATALEAFSPGALPAIQPEKLRFKGPIHLISGQADGSYTARLRDVANRLPNAKLTLLPSTGHSPQFEKPGDFCAAINDVIAAE